MSALIESYSAANRVVETDLAVRYSRTRATGSWTHTYGIISHTYYEAWSYTRTATKSYKYIGMTKTAADACAADMRTLYQRSTIVSKWTGDGSEFTTESGGTVPMADVAVQRVDGDMWEVVVNVNESDSRLMMAITPFATLFSAENNRDYDTGS